MRLHIPNFLNINPIFCDIDPDSHLIDPTKIETLITNKTSAILSVPIWGQPLNYKALESIAKKYNLKLIFDSAHAFGCKSENKYMGGFGDAAIFSFHTAKNLFLWRRRCDHYKLRSSCEEAKIYTETLAFAITTKHYQLELMPKCLN